jgi:hypothetical protein
MLLRRQQFKDLSKDHLRLPIKDRFKSRLKGQLMQGRDLYRRDHSKGLRCSLKSREAITITLLQKRHRQSLLRRSVLLSLS